MKWIRANERLPTGRGVDNSVIIRGCDMPPDGHGHAITGKFVTTGFVNFDDDNPKFYFIYGQHSFLSNETIEWLDESEPEPPQGKTMEAKEILEHEIQYDQQKMFLEDSFVVARHNGIEYRLINERVVIMAINSAIAAACEEKEEAIRELVEDMVNRRKSHAKKKQESMDSYQDQYCHGRVDECDYIIRKLTLLKNII
jgi:hypothetical protein